MTHIRYSKTNDLHHRNTGTHPDLLEADAVAFQPDSVEIDLRKLPRAAHALLVISIALMVLALIWSGWAKVDRTVTASGRLISQGE